MNLVRNEIDRLNQEISQRGSVAMIFQRGNIKVSHPRTVLARGRPLSYRNVSVTWVP